MKACRLRAGRAGADLADAAGRPLYARVSRGARKADVSRAVQESALCAEVMITAVRRLGVDAAIIFSDLLPILEPMGLELEFAHGEGPVIHNPVREARDVDRVRELDDVGSAGVRHGNGAANAGRVARTRFR